jgi:hypothetical protein
MPFLCAAQSLLFSCFAITHLLCYDFLKKSFVCAAGAGPKIETKIVKMVGHKKPQVIPCCHVGNLQEMMEKLDFLK